ncbi:DUF938 domain-containing protein [uncultured Roseovarius sp.]|uniref:DUF938 domain-containing protein n=1 Tax=uncultured Roseovarius sp. TaxID=293344 RepID=UPI00263217A6|nr:DUF938 domain-containing protein [uncultured Roseovarius sp.]
MTRHRHLPQTASIAEPGDDGRLHAPAAARNAQAIIDLMIRYAPSGGKALEIASGTGQHVAGLARALPALTWQPSEIDAARRGSINSWAAQIPNILPAIPLDATTPGWSVCQADQDLILLVNLLHLISIAETRILITEVARALAPGGRFCLYGPFLRDGITVSDGDASFDASLRAADPEIGYKDVGAVQRWLADSGLRVIATVDMPANNLTLISERPAETP